MKETITLENAKVLHAICKEKGVEMRGSYWHWWKKDYTSKFSACKSTGWYAKQGYDISREEGEIIHQYPAYTTNELLEWLPQTYFTRKHFGVGTKQWHYAIYHATEEAYIEGEILVSDGHTSDTPQDALCLLLIELISNGVIN